MFWRNTNYTLGGLLYNSLQICKNAEEYAILALILKNILGIIRWLPYRGGAMAHLPRPHPHRRSDAWRLYASPGLVLYICI